METEPDAKRRKTTQRPPPRRTVSTPLVNKEKAARHTTQSLTGTSTGFNLWIEQARRFAVTQAQQEGCTGNYKVFDSPYGNFLVPVLPTRAELDG